MGATINALGIIASAVLALISVLWLRSPHGGRRGTAVAVVAVLAGLAAALLLPAVRESHPGQPALQFEVPMAAIVVIGFAVGRRPLLLALIAAEVLLAIFLSNQYYDLVLTRSGWTGPYSLRRLNDREVVRQAQVAIWAYSSDNGDRRLPAGWIDRPPLGDLVRSYDPHVTWPPQRLRRAAVWHTWFTGLYRREPLPFGLWYPGGKPSEQAEHLEWRPRPLPSAQ